MIIRMDIKSALKTANKSSADLARGIEINYEVLNRYLNGRAKMPVSIEKKITAKIEEWNGSQSSE